MSTTASLDSSSVRLDPGDQVVIPLQIRNNGEIVEGYKIEVVGAPAAWATVEPETVSLYPGSSTTATVSFHPPRSAQVPAGEQQFGVVVTPAEHPDEAVVPEGVIEVLPFLETTAELMPHTSQGSRHGRHQVAVDNRGNVPVTALLDGTDDGNRVDFRIQPPAITVSPGQAVFVDVKVRPVKRLWRGAPVTHPFSIVVSPQESTPVSLDGSYLQQPTIPKWLPKALLALLALLIALAAIWFLLLKPTIESSAKEAAEQAVADDVAAVEEQAVAAEEGAEAAQEEAANASQAAGSAEGSATEADKAATKVEKLAGLPPTPKTITNPIARRLAVADPAGGETSTATFPVPEDSTLKLTDLVLSNPQGDFGTVTVLLDDAILFESALENFRDIDYHFVSPISATEGQDLTMEVQCNEVGSPPGAPAAPENCNTGMYFGGDLTEPAPKPGD